MDNGINYEQLAQVVKEKKESSRELQDSSHKEIISSLIKEQHSTTVGGGINGQGTDGQTNNNNGQKSDYLASYSDLASGDAKQRVEGLIKYTFERGLREGIELGAKEDPFVLDLFHDSLTEKLYEELKNRNLI